VILPPLCHWKKEEKAGVLRSREREKVAVRRMRVVGIKTIPVEMWN
jgi:hypothetical protein